MALNQMFAYKALRAQSIKASLLNADVAGSGIVLNGDTNALELNVAAAKGLEVLEDALGIKLDDVDTFGSLEVSANGLRLANTIKGARTFAGDVTVNGNMIIKGTTTTVNSTVVDVADRMMDLNSYVYEGVDIAVPIGYSGVSVERGTENGGTYRDHAGFLWDEANSKFVAALMKHDESGLNGLLDVEVKDFKGVNGNFTGTLQSGGKATLESLEVTNGATFKGAMGLDAGKTFTLGLGALIDGSDAGKAAYQISFEKQGASWAVGETPATVGAALDVLRSDIANAAQGAAGDLTTYFDELRSDGIMGTAAAGSLGAGLALFTGGRVAYVSGNRFEMAAVPAYDASALADGGYKLWIDEAGLVQNGAAYPAEGGYAKIGSITVTGGAVTAYVDEHRPLVALDEKVISVETKIDNFIALIAGQNGASNVGVTDTIANALGLDGSAGKEKTVENSIQGMLKFRMRKVRQLVDAAFIATAVDGYCSIAFGNSYPVDKENTLVFVDGVMQDEGSEKFYVEVDATHVKVKAEDLVEGMNLLVWVAPFVGIA